MSGETAQAIALQSLVNRPLDDAGDIAIATVNRHLDIYDSSVCSHSMPSCGAASCAADVSLFDMVAEKIADNIGDNIEELRAVFSLPPNILRRMIRQWDKAPYHAWCTARGHVGKEEFENFEEGKARAPHDEAFFEDLDEFILRNERRLRDTRTQDWSRGLVKLSGDMDAVCPKSTVTDTARTFVREELSGYKILDSKRAPSIEIQPSVARFASVFEVLSDGLLKGLDWTNIFVAGGMVLGSLLCTDPAQDAGKYIASDIDIYIYGLGPIDANAKIHSIYNTWKSNLPARAPSLIVHNSRTITFFSNYPTKRIQIVLKLVENPREVLLNFDLDVCAVGWDGSEVWMLPRAIRALETGYNVFTTDLTYGHYLGTRRASQEERIFKYADKGYGIRILPSYLKALEGFDDVEKLSRGDERLQEPKIDVIAENARKWTDEQIAGIVPYHRDPVHRLSHSKLFAMYDAPLGTTCLTGFECFMRHVTLWQRGAEGKVVIDDNNSALEDYDNEYVPLRYSDIAPYPWGPDFHLEPLTSWLDGFTLKEQYRLESNLGGDGANIDQFGTSSRIRRAVYARNIEDIFEPKGDLVIPLFLPASVITFANDLIQTVMEAHGLLALKSATSAFLKPVVDDDYDQPQTWYGGPEQLVFWRITSITAWQQIDRRIDELYEILWSFHHANAITGSQGRLQRFVDHLAKRAIRWPTGGEMESFAYWVGKLPPPPRARFSRAVERGEYMDDHEYMDDW